MGRWCQKGSKVRPMAHNHPLIRRTMSGYLLSWSWCCKDLLKAVSCMPLTNDRFLEAAWRPRPEDSGFSTNGSIRKLVTLGLGKGKLADEN